MTHPLGAVDAPAVPASSTTPGSDAGSDPPVLLSYRTLGVGDLLTAVPALRGLRRTFPEHRHVLAAPALLGPLVELIDAVDVHVAVGELAVLPAAVAPIDVAVNLHGAGPQSHARLLASEPRWLLAHRHPEVWPRADAPTWDPELHERDRWCRLVRSGGGTAAADDLALPVPTTAPPAMAVGATVVHPGAKAPARRWPVARFAAVARAEREAGRRVVVTGDADDVPLAVEVATRAGLPDGAVLAGRSDLGDLAAMVACAARVVCGDTGVAHLATAFGTPSVVLFGPSAPERWGPPPDRRDRHRVLWAGRTGDPLDDVPDPGLLEIGTGDVLRELASLDELGAARSAVGPGPRRS